MQPLVQEYFMLIQLEFMHDNKNDIIG